MAEDIEIDEWEMYDALAKIKTDDSLAVVRSKKTELPKNVIRWKEIVGEFSLYNDYAAIMSYYVSLGQILKDMVRIPIGRLSLDPRIHFCWIQTSRSGKTTMFDFLAPVWAETFELINKHPTTKDSPTTPLAGVKEFTLNNPDSFTDQALLGTLKINVPNPDYNRGEARNDDDYDVPEFIDTTIYGSLYGSGLIAFDEFEHSGIFKETQVPESLKSKMEEDYIAMVGEIIEDDDGAAPYQEEFAEMLYSSYRWVEQRLEEEGGDPRKVVVFSSDAQKRLKTVWKGMRKYMISFDNQIYEALNTFLMNMINNICIAAALCAISERSKVITAAHINQGRQLTDESFDSITGWFTDKLKKRPKRIADKNNERMYVTAYNLTNPKTRQSGTDGWVDKKLMIETFRKQEQCGRNKFYRHWQSVSHLFEELRTSKTYVKLKVKKDE